MPPAASQRNGKSSWAKSSEALVTDTIMLTKDGVRAQVPFPVRALRHADRTCIWLGRVVLGISSLCLIVAAIVGAVDVVSTAFFKRPVPLTVELSSYLLPLIVFGTLAYAQQRREHVAVDLVTNRLAKAVQGALQTLALVAGLAVFSLLAWRSGVLFLDSFERGETASAAYAFSVWPFKLAAFVALTVAALEFLRQLAWTLAGTPWQAPDEAKGVHE